MADGPQVDWTKAQSIGANDVDWAKAQPVNGSTPPVAAPSTLQKIGTGALDVFTGIGKGFASTANNLGHIVLPDAAARALHLPVPSAEQQESYFKPKNTAEAIGKGAEQAGEFMLPGGAEEEGAAKIASLMPKAEKYIAPAAHIATSALGAGAVNKAQGGNFGTGALMGAGGQIVGQGLKMAAPAVAESALGIPKVARAFGKTPGAAILNETRGIRPETIAESAQSRMNELTPELERAAAASPAKASLLPARRIVMDAGNKAASQNAEGLFNQIGKQGDFLNYGGPTGEVTPSKLLDLKRGFNEEHLRWNPEMHDRALSTGRQAYSAMDKELDWTVPEAAGLNQRISSLIPVAQRAESVSRNAPTVQRALGRFGAHTGALTLGTAGAYEGRREAGLPGMIAGGLTGVLAPELIASPEGQMALARMLNKAGGLKPVVGAALQGNRKKAQQ